MIPQLTFIGAFLCQFSRAQSRTIAADTSSEERWNWSCREQEVYDEQRRPFAYVCHSRCGGSDPVVKSLDMNIHDHIANREHSPKTSADGHRPPIMCIYGPIGCNDW